MIPTGRAMAHRVAGYGLALAALVGVFLLYLQPDFMVALAQQVWACF